MWVRLAIILLAGVGVIFAIVGHLYDPSGEFGSKPGTVYRLVAFACWMVAVCVAITAWLVSALKKNRPRRP
ncbi:MAG TPA: hypothetical protein VFA18_17495 [Gemmataceae bacterium]|nr:hypothetical protein [Gemmataceae bacterium]